MIRENNSLTELEQVQSDILKLKIYTQELHERLSSYDKGKNFSSLEEPESPKVFNSPSQSQSNINIQNILIHKRTSIEDKRDNKFCNKRCCVIL